ncbi:hypothetical protein D3C87_1302270 [compost metagenome]
MQHGGGGLGARGRLDAGPEFAQVLHIRRQLLIVGAFRLSAYDEAAFLLGRHQSLQPFAQLNAFGLGVDLLGDADMRVVGQIHQHAPRHADLSGKPGALGA